MIRNPYMFNIPRTMSTIPMSLISKKVGSNENAAMMPKEDNTCETGIENMIVDDRTAWTILAFPIPSALI